MGDLRPVHDAITRHGGIVFLLPMPVHILAAAVIAIELQDKGSGRKYVIAVDLDDLISDELGVNCMVMIDDAAVELVRAELATKR